MKDFDQWNTVKKRKNEKQRLFFRERDIWWMSFGLNIGDEEDGKGEEFVRPILIIKKFNHNLFWGCALSSKIKLENRYYVKIRTKNVDRSVIVSQLRLYDSKRLRNKLEKCAESEFAKIKQAIKDML